MTPRETPPPYKHPASVVSLRWYHNKDCQTWGEEAEQIVFQTSLVSPKVKRHHKLDESAGLPLVFYFGAINEALGEPFLQRCAEVASVASQAFVLVQAERPKGKNWFIDDAGVRGFIEGEFLPELVETYARWMTELTTKQYIDKQKVAMYGFSAGAYACLELLADGGCPPLCGVGLAGAHGHGRGDLSEVSASISMACEDKFPAFLNRMTSHVGAAWIEATHAESDLKCHWDDAVLIFDELNARQAELGHPEVAIRQVADEDMDRRPGPKKNSQYHEYSKFAFMRAEFFNSLLGAPPLPEDDRPTLADVSGPPPSATRGPPASASTRPVPAAIQGRPMPADWEQPKQKKKRSRPAKGKGTRRGDDDDAGDTAQEALGRMRQDSGRGASDGEDELQAAFRAHLGEVGADSGSED